MKRQTNRWMKKKTDRLIAGQIIGHRLVDKETDTLMARDKQTYKGMERDRQTDKWMEKQTKVDGERLILVNGENDCQIDTWMTRQITNEERDKYEC